MITSTVTQAAQLSSGEETETFAFFWTSIWDDTSSSWAPILTSITYDVNYPVIQSSGLLWNYWVATESRFPDVYFINCENDVITAYIDDSGNIGHTKTYPCSECQTEYLFKNPDSNEAFMSNIFCAADWTPRAFYKQLSNDDIHRPPTMTGSAPASTETKRPLWSPIASVTTESPFSTLFPQPPPALPIIRPDILSTGTSDSLTTTIISIATAFSTVFSTPIQTKTLENPTSIWEDPPSDSSHGSPRMLLITILCPTFGVAFLLVLLVYLVRRRKRKANPYTPSNPMMQIHPSIAPGVPASGGCDNQLDTGFLQLDGNPRVRWPDLPEFSGRTSHRQQPR